MYLMPCQVLHFGHKYPSLNFMTTSKGRYDYLFYFNKDFLIWIIFKVFIEFLTILLIYALVFGLEACKIAAPLFPLFLPHQESNLHWRVKS